ncbi:uncharacterized protein LOC130751547 [Actinidia eriantha]|uniref:uncharacterized protein LOC130751547 n=1 Tax=Actinidia eriantha TaxID=165200 RepID=UPI00258AFA7C|nr:uncharacterized protein LOC130751547 [Actinidia eriantha]
MAGKPAAIGSITKPSTSNGTDPKKILANYAVKGLWPEVVDIYKRHPELHDAKVTITHDTALHMAVLSGQEDVVKKLVHIISMTGDRIGNAARRAVNVQNERGNTPLHLAAELGNVEMCNLIATVDPELIDVRNKESETPFFLAALNGKKDAFLCLHDLIIPDGNGNAKTEKVYTYCRRNHDGQTILHVAIEKEYFVFRRNIQNKQADPKRQANPDPERQDQDDHPMFPVNYQICYELIKLFLKSALIILGVGFREIRKIQRKREKHTWSVQIMNKLLENSSRQYEYLDNGQKPVGLLLDEDMFTAGIDEEQALDKGPEKQLMTGSQESIFKEIQAMRADLGKIAAIEVLRHMEGLQSPNTNIDPTLKNETPILLAAKNGIKEMVEEILNTIPSAINDTNTEGKNIVLLAVECRQTHVYKLLLERMVGNESVFRRVDNEGNSALHLAAKLGNYRPWLVSGAALQIQWEYKWYEFVKKSMPLHFFIHLNKKGDTPRDVFTDTHKGLVESSRKWLTNTAQSCSVVAALIAGVVFTTVSAVPGGLKQDDSGQPVFEKKLAFSIFSIAALVALYSSVTALVIFLAILTSHYEEKNFHKGLPRSLPFGLVVIFVSIFAMLVSFSAGHFFVLKDSLEYMSLPVYAIMCFSVTIFVMAQLFPLYFDLIKAGQVF